MGLLDKIRGMLGRQPHAGETRPEAKDRQRKTPEDVLRDAGVDPAGMEFTYLSSSGLLVIEGFIPDEEARERALAALTAVPGVKEIDDRLSLPEVEGEVDLFAAVEQTAPSDGVEPAPYEAPAEPAEDVRSDDDEPEEGRRSAVDEPDADPGIMVESEPEEQDGPGGEEHGGGDDPNKGWP